MATEGYRLWHAMHADCGTGATCCGRLEMDTSGEELQRLQVAAKLMGLTVGEFVHAVVTERVKPLQRMIDATDPAFDTWFALLGDVYDEDDQAGHLMSAPYVLEKV